MIAVSFLSLSVAVNPALNFSLTVVLFNVVSSLDFRLLLEAMLTITKLISSNVCKLSVPSEIGRFNPH